MGSMRARRETGCVGHNKARGGQKDLGAAVDGVTWLLYHVNPSVNRLLLAHRELGAEDAHGHGLQQFTSDRCEHKHATGKQATQASLLACQASAIAGSRGSQPRMRKTCGPTACKPGAPAKASLKAAAWRSPESAKGQSQRCES